MANEATDETFGPLSASWLDFTLFFEHTILGILPTGLLIATTPLYFYICAKRPVYTRAGFILWAELAVSIALIGIEIASLVFYTRTPSIRTDTALVAASLSCVGSLAITFLLFIEYRHSLRPSALLTLYIILSLVIDVVKSRSYFIRHELQVLGALSVAAAAMKLCITILQEVPKRHLLVNTELRISSGREATGGFFYRSFFAWLNSIFAAGFNSVLKLKDLEHLSPDLASQTLYPKFLEIWESRKHDVSGGRLAIACLHTLWWHFLAVPLPRLLFSILTLTQPFLLQRILDCLGNDNASLYERVGLIAATFLTFTTRAMAQGSYKHASYRLVTATRGVLIAAMADKQLRISHTEAKKSAISTLMTADVEGIEATLPSFHDLWGFLFDIGFGLYLLSKLIRLASLSIFAPFIFSVLYGYLIGKRAAKALTAWNTNIQLRLSKMTNILSQQIPIRMMGLGPVVAQYAQNLRATEMQHSKKFRICTTTTMTGAVFIEAFTPVIILTSALFWATFPGGFTAYEAFPILALITIVQMPLFYLIDTFGNILRAWACFNRIQAYLQLAEWEDCRKYHEAAVDSTNETQSGEKQIECANADTGNDILYEFIEAWVSPPGCAGSILKGINIQILRSRVVSLLGPIACGKSTFLRCLLGEARLLDGTIRMTKKGMTVAFCDQTPWLHNGTLRENILGPNPYDEEWYRTVVAGCLLLEDFAQLSKGDQTVVGSNGMNLSVGQRHRVSLARAVFTRADVIVIDDIFSSQDQVTARAIVKRLLGQGGLLRQSTTTVVLATHLSAVLDVSDEALVFDGDGNIYRHNDIASFELKSDLASSMDVTMQMSGKAQEVDDGTNAESKPHFTKSSTTKASESKSSNDIRRRGDFGLYRFYFRAINKPLFLLWIISMAAVAFCDNFPNGYVRIWVDKDPNNNLYLLGFALLAFGRVAIGLWSQRMFYLRILPDSGEKLHKMLLSAVMDATFDYICSVDSGDLLNRFSQDMNLVVQALPLAMYRFVFMLFSTWIELGFVLAGASYATISLPFVLGIVYTIQKYYLRTSRQLRHLDLEAKIPLYVCFKETANGLQHIRTFGWSEAQLRRNLIFVDESQKPYYQMFCAQRWLVLVLDLTVSAVAVVIVGVALNVKNSSSPAAIGLAYLIMINFGGTIASLIQRFTEMEIALGSISRTRAFVEDTPREQGPPRRKVPDNWPNKGKIELKNVTAKYSSDSVLTDLSFVIRAGDKVALTGQSGSGKSSLFVTLLNFLEYSGSILIDGVDISNVPRQLLRERITTITQTPVVIDDTVRYNLVPWDDGHKFPDSIIKNTLRQLGLWEQIKLKRGLGAQLENAGLSVAQLQLLCIARAILHHIQTESNIVLMDEATASLSVASTLEVQRVIKEAFQGCTVLNIAHWDSPLQKPDIEVHIDKGKLVSARRDAPDSEDEATAEERLIQDEKEKAYIERMRLQADQEQREILAREKAFEAKLQESSKGEDCGHTLQRVVVPPETSLELEHEPLSTAPIRGAVGHQNTYVPSAAGPSQPAPYEMKYGNPTPIPPHCEGSASLQTTLSPPTVLQTFDQSTLKTAAEVATQDETKSTDVAGTVPAPIFQFEAPATQPQERRFATPHARLPRNGLYSTRPGHAARVNRPPLDPSGL